MNLLNKSLLTIVSIFALSFLIHSGHKTDLDNSAVRSRVVELKGIAGLCSGIQVKGATGNSYILSAGHCKPLQSDGSIMVQTEDDRLLSRRVILDDPNSDLLLIEGVPNMEGIDVAHDLEKQDKVHSFTHGRGFATYRTDGVFVDTTKILINAMPENIDECKLFPKYEPNPNYDPNDPLQRIYGVPPCLLSVHENAMTAMIVPGSSGGAIVNDHEELVGIASATDGMFGYMVTLDDIQNLMANY